MNSCSFQVGLLLKEEMAKDLSHDVNVCFWMGFYSLVVEFGTWSVHSLEVLMIIVRRMSLSQTLSVSRAVRSLHELLSVRPWQYNARMVLDRLHLVTKDCFLDYIYIYRI